MRINRNEFIWCISARKRNTIFGKYIREINDKACMSLDISTNIFLFVFGEKEKIRKNILNYINLATGRERRCRKKNESQITNKFHQIYHCAITNWNQRFYENNVLILTAMFFLSMLTYCELLTTVIRPTNIVAFASHNNWSCYISDTS